MRWDGFGMDRMTERVDKARERATSSGFSEGGGVLCVVRRCACRVERRKEVT